MKLYHTEFVELFKGRIIITPETEEKLMGKHNVYVEDIEDALGDPFAVVILGQQKQSSMNGTNYEIYAETESKRVLFIVGKLFSDGNFYIITSYWANNEMIKFYFKTREVLSDDRN